MVRSGSIVATALLVVICQSRGNRKVEFGYKPGLMQSILAYILRMDVCALAG
eukprot:COSAG01_NODE_3686_length_5796_cov_13.667720_6_plen_52_part_00